MSNTRRTKAQRRRVARERAAASYAEREFGIAWRPDRLGRMTLAWTVDRDPFLALMSLDRLRKQLGEAEREIVVAARLAGCTWDDIGFALGMSRSAAFERHREADVLVDEALAASGGGV